MKQFNSSFTDINLYLNNSQKPDFNNILKILRREKPDRLTLFEFFLNDNLYFKFAGIEETIYDDPDEYNRLLIKAFYNAGYDYVTLSGSDFGFNTNRPVYSGKKSISLNEGAIIFDRDSFNNYKWIDPENSDYSRLDSLSEHIPEGMKIIIRGPGGILENIIALIGYDNLCYMLADDPELVGNIFDEIGSRLVKYYEICSKYESVGALISNDDWGFNTQTMLSIEDMRKYVIPWHKKIVETIHKRGKPVILHSCGRLDGVMDEILYDIKYDGKHSYEDKITPVEDVYEKLGNKIAIMGGIDVDFICRATPEEVYNRSVAMIERTSERGGFALGSGNSIPYYVPEENYLAMIAAVIQNR